MKRTVICLVVCLLLVGCGGKVCHPYKTAQDFERDKYDCQMKTRSGSAEMMLVDMEHYLNCMRIEKGWEKCPD